MGARCKEQQRQQVAELTREEKWQLAFDKFPDQEKVDTLLFGKEKIVTGRWRTGWSAVES